MLHGYTVTTLKKPTDSSCPNNLFQWKHEQSLIKHYLHIPILGIVMSKFTAYIERDPETGFYVAVVPGIPGAHTQAETLDELQKNITEVVEMCIGEMDPRTRKLLPEFIGIQQIEVSV
ncbi:hypothetical protein BMS3Abin16_01796 [archaeon BMS3Abin16]|nr:hypothetical protein BMS3Abin16_01796 [archaeon BMS3Abin16]